MKTLYHPVHRHTILLFFMTVRYFFYVLLILIWVLFVALYENSIPKAVILYLIFPLAIIAINYSFVRIILAGLNYYGRLILIGEQSIIFMKTSLILIDDIESMDMKSILKVDVECHGLIANVLNYGHIHLEQRNQIRSVHYVPYPHIVYEVIKTKLPQRDTLGPI